LRTLISVLAFKLSLVVLALSFVTLLTGITGNSPRSPAILTFNVSSLGLEDFHDAFSPLHANITSLIPSDITNPPSITRYLGACDWYTVHYFSNCSGFYAPSVDDPSILTSEMIDITCTRQYSGYNFNPHDVVESQLFPSVVEVAHSVSTFQYMTGTWISLWYSGMSNCAITLFTLPWNFWGQRPGINRWAWWDSFITTVMFLASSAMVTNTVITVNHAHGLPGHNPGSAGFLGVMWLTTTLMAVICAILWVRWGMEGHRSVDVCGEPIRARAHRQRSAYGDMIPLQRRKSDKTLVEVESTYSYNQRNLQD